MNHHFEKTGDLRVHWIEDGRPENPALVLLHGGGIDCAGLSWKTAIPVLAEFFHILAPDFPGSGQSEHSNFEHPISDYTQFLEAWLRSRVPENFYLAGISMGGAVSLGFVLRSPHRVKRLILVDSYGLSDDVPLGMLTSISARFPGVYKFVGNLARRHRGLALKGLGFLLGERNDLTPEIENDAFDLISSRPLSQNWINFMKDEFSSGKCRTNFCNDLNRVQIPVLIIHGEKDRLIPTDVALRASQLLPDAKLEIIPGSGHLPPREATGRFCKIVREFLS